MRKKWEVLPSGVKRLVAVSTALVALYGGYQVLDAAEIRWTWIREFKFHTEEFYLVAANQSAYLLDIAKGQKYNAEQRIRRFRRDNPRTQMVPNWMLNDVYEAERNIDKYQRRLRKYGK